MATIWRASSRGGNNSTSSRGRGSGASASTPASSRGRGQSSAPRTSARGRASSSSSSSSSSRGRGGNANANAAGTNGNGNGKSGTWSRGGTASVQASRGGRGERSSSQNRGASNVQTRSARTTQNTPAAPSPRDPRLQNRHAELPRPDPASKDYMKQMTEKFQILKQRRDLERKEAIQNGFLADPDKPTSLAHAITPVGTCTDFCPEFERVERIVQNMVERAEKVTIDESERDVPAEERMVKRFRRSAAGYDEQLPSDIRTPATLRATLDYLLDEVIGGDERLGTIHKFVWDRTRGIRNDFSIQQLTKVDDLTIAIDCLERIARFHILSLHQLSHPNNPDQFDRHQEREQLNNTLLSLMYYYDDNRERMSFTNEAEFRAYGIIFAIQDQRPDLQARMQLWPKELLASPRVQIALELHYAAGNTIDAQGPIQPRTPYPIAQANFGRFWSLLKSRRVSYLMACVAEIYFDLVRHTAIQSIYKAYKRAPLSQQHKNEDWTLAELKKFLGFDRQSEVLQYCEEQGLQFGTLPGGRLYLDWGRSTVDSDNFGFSHSSKQDFSRKFVEAKRYSRTYVSVINGISAAEAIRKGLIEVNEMGDGGDEEMEEDVDVENSLFLPETPMDKNAASSSQTKNPFGLNPAASTFAPSGFSNSTPSIFGSTAFGAPANAAASSSNNAPSFNPFGPKPAAKPLTPVTGSSMFGQTAAAAAPTAATPPAFNPFGKSASQTSVFGQSAALSETPKPATNPFGVSDAAISSVPNSDAQKSTRAFFNSPPSTPAPDSQTRNAIKSPSSGFGIGFTNDASPSGSINGEAPKAHLFETPSTPALPSFSAPAFGSTDFSAKASGSVLEASKPSSLESISGSTSAELKTLPGPSSNTGFQESSSSPFSGFISRTPSAPTTATEEKKGIKSPFSFTEPTSGSSVLFATPTTTTMPTTSEADKPNPFFDSSRASAPAKPAIAVTEPFETNMNSATSDTGFIFADPTASPPVPPSPTMAHASLPSASNARTAQKTPETSELQAGSLLQQHDFSTAYLHKSQTAPVAPEQRPKSPPKPIPSPPSPKSTPTKSIIPTPSPPVAKPVSSFGPLAPNTKPKTSSPLARPPYTAPESSEQGASRSNLCERLALELMTERYGVLAQFVEYHAGSIIRDAVKEFEDEHSWAQAKETRQYLLCRKYGLRWHWFHKMKAGKRRRARLSESVMLANKRAISGAQEDELAKKMRRSVSGSAATRDESALRLKAKRDSLSSDASPVLKRKRAHHKRSRTLDMTTTSALAKDNESSFRQSTQSVRELYDTSIDLRKSVYGQRIDTTRSTYFKLKARGIDPETPVVPDTARSLSRKRARDSGSDWEHSSSKIGKLEIPESPRIEGSLAIQEVSETPSRDEDPLLAELRELRKTMSEDIAWFREESTNIESASRSPSRGKENLQPSPPPSYGRVNGYDVAFAPQASGRSLSRSEMRIRSTGAKGLAHKPLSAFSESHSGVSNRSYGPFQGSTTASFSSSNAGVGRVSFGSPYANGKQPARSVSANSSYLGLGQSSSLTDDDVSKSDIASASVLPRNGSRKTTGKQTVSTDPGQRGMNKSGAWFDSRDPEVDEEVEYEEEDSNYDVDEEEEENVGEEEDEEESTGEVSDANISEYDDAGDDELEDPEDEYEDEELDADEVAEFGSSQADENEAGAGSALQKGFSGVSSQAQPRAQISGTPGLGHGVGGGQGSGTTEEDAFVLSD